jgi:LysR family hydrogen peroxide-inducible transcriptional activator
LTIGVLPTIAPYLLPKALTAFVKANPEVQVIVHEDTTARLLRLAHAFEIDFAFASEPLADDRVQIQELFTEELLLAVPPKHSLASKSQIRAEDLEREPLIVMKEGHCLGDQVVRFCERKDLHASISFRSAQLETIQSLVRAGLGISFIPAMAASASRAGSPVYRPLEGTRPMRNIVAVWHKQRPLNRAAAEFLKFVRKP